MCLGAAEGFKILPIEGLGDGNNRAEICIPATFGLGIWRRRKVFANVDTMYHKPGRNRGRNFNRGSKCTSHSGSSSSATLSQSHSSSLNSVIRLGLSRELGGSACSDEAVFVCIQAISELPP